MSGVRVARSRLEELRALRDRVNLEILAEERRIALELPAKRKPASTGRKRNDAGNSVDQRLVELGTTARKVREWARAVGLEVKRQGRIGSALLDAWEAAHPDARKRAP